LISYPSTGLSRKLHLENTATSRWASPIAAAQRPSPVACHPANWWHRPYGPPSCHCRTIVAAAHDTRNLPHRPRRRHTAGCVTVATATMPGNPPRSRFMPGVPIRSPLPPQSRKQGKRPSQGMAVRVEAVPPPPLPPPARSHATLHRRQHEETQACPLKNSNSLVTPHAPVAPRIFIEDGVVAVAITTSPSKRRGKL
jgi:hypothetical protein